MHTGSSSRRGSRPRPRSSSPPPERRLRPSKSSEFLHSVRRRVSLKNIRFGLGRASTDESEHPSLTAPNTSNPPFQPPASHLPKWRFLGNRSKRNLLEEVPPMPPLPVDMEEQPIEIDADLDDRAMEGIVDRAALYPDLSYANSPGSDPYSSSQSADSSSQYGRPILRNPFAQTHVPRTWSPEPVGPTDISASHGLNKHYNVPDSWAVNRPRRDPDGESTSDNGHPDNVAELPRWKIRIYGPDNNEHILWVTAKDTVASLTPKLNAKLPPGEEREAHELYLKERGRERVLKQSERPANILTRCLHQAGYDEFDGDGGTGRGSIGIPGVPFLLKFVYRSQFLGPTDAELSFNNLVYINLVGRSLVTIPVVLHQHADTIVSLRLSRNPMTDIPLDFIQSCTALSELYLSHMCMKKPPHSVAYIATLTLLDLSSNRIASLDEAALDELPRLTTLDIQNNRLERLTRALPRSLLNLNISNNKFDAFPVSVTELTHLSRLDISFNTISELPREIGRLARLTKLVIVGNQISVLPNEFGNLALLSELDCRRNQIADLAVACGLPELTFLSADHNNLHTLALPLGPRLQGLDISHNDITELPLGGDTFTLPSALTYLDISNAKLSVLDEGTLSQLLSLRNLRLDRNLFRTLPESLGDLKWLESLSCADNMLSKLPESVGKLQKLESLDLHNNSLTALPPSLWNCASLLRLNVTSNLLLVWHDPPSSIPDEPPPIPIGRLLPSPTFSPRRPSVSTSPDIPPLAHSLEMLYLAENSLTDESLHPLMILKALRVLNLSLNAIQELPSDFFKDLTKLEEVFLSGNRLTHIPSQDLPRLERLSTLFLNGNHLQHLPHELGQVKSLVLLDVGNNVLKYNINNLDYDWNWNFNKNLVYLNLSGNEQLQIKSDVSGHGRPSISSIQRQSLAGFSRLPRLRVLGLMDVTITNTGMNTGSDIPDETDDRRVRTSSSLVNGLSYGIADTLGKNRHPHMMDLVHEFRGLQKATVFAMFGRSHPANQTVATTCNGLPKYLKDHFIRVFISQLNCLDGNRAEGVPDALRRSFLKLNQDYHDLLFGAVRKMSLAGTPAAEASIVNHGASGIVVYIIGKKMYVANVGNALAIVSRGGTAHPVSHKHEPYDRAETARIRDAEGWISPAGLVGDELDISRSFGFYHLLPMVNARPNICEHDLSSMDEMIIIANRGLWDYVEYQTAVDIVRGMKPTAAAQKLRDLAISYGAEGSTMIMVVSLADSVPADRPRRHGIRVIDRTLEWLKDEVPPPMGHIAIVFTDIKSSTHLWEATASGMITAIHLHNSLLRRYLRICGGYEVRTEGDSFMCSFPTVLAAVWWCLTIQVELLKVPWPQDILECPDGKEVYDVEGRLIYRGLSVRIGIHCGSPLCSTDPVTTRMDYFGLMVTRAARIASVAAGGQIMFSADVLNEINARVFETEPTTEYSDSQPKEAIDAIRQLEPAVVAVGEKKLKGLEAPEMLSFVLPAALIGRRSHNEPVVVDNPARVVNPGLTTLRSHSSGHFDIIQIRELARLCARLEMASADPELFSMRNESDVLTQDLDVLLPPNTDMTDTELSTILYSLAVRIENVETVLRGRSSSASLTTKRDLVAALRNLDERTLREVWSMFSC